MNFIFVSPFDLVTERFWGPTLRIYMLAKELNRMGHEAYLLGPPPYNRPKPTMLNGVPLLYFKDVLYRYPYPDKEQKAVSKEQPARFKIPLLLLKRTLQLRGMIKKIRPDFLIINRANVDTAYPVLFNHFWKSIPLIYHWDDIEGLHGFCSSFRLPLAYQLFCSANETSMSRLANVTVVASDFIRNFSRNIGVPENRIFYAPTVADTELFHPELNGSEVRKRYGLDGKKVLLYVGNLFSGNGVKVENIVYAAALLKEKVSEIKVMILGDGDLVRKDGKDGPLIRLTRELGLEDTIIFTGNIPYSQVPTYVAASDLCLALFPINVITLAKSPLKVYEYMAAGKPVVVRAVGECVRCVRHGETGFLVYSDDPVEYSRTIGTVLENEHLLKQTGQAARRDVETTFSWQNSARVLLQAASRAKEVQHTHSKFIKKKKHLAHSPCESQKAWTD